MKKHLKNLLSAVLMVIFVVIICLVSINADTIVYKLQSFFGVSREGFHEKTSSILFLLAIIVFMVVCVARLLLDKTKRRRKHGRKQLEEMDGD